MGVELALWLSVAALAGSVVAGVMVASRQPTALAKRTEKLTQEVVAKWRSECELFEATRARWTEEFAGIAERCDETLERAESKRRRVAANASRQPQAESGGPPWEGMSREQIIENARRGTLGGNR
jgi:hypothetical protein